MANHCWIYASIFITCVLYSWAESQHIDQRNATDLIAWTGEDVDLHCGDNQSESANRYWNRGDEILTVANTVWASNSRIESLNQSIILRINNVSVDDEGQYTCVANTKSIHQLTFNLQVKEFTCEQPDKPMNGDFEGDSNSSYTFNDQIQYFCHRGFELVGSAVRTCSGPPHGWTPDEPSCEPDYIVRLQKSVAVVGDKMPAMESKITSLENKITTVENITVAVTKTVTNNTITLAKSMEDFAKIVASRLTSMNDRMKTYEDDCRNGFFKLGDKCYYISTKLESWHDALKVCQTFRSTLAYPKNSLDNSLLRDHLTRYFHSSNFWVGGTDEAEEGRWVWTHNQSPITYTDWLAGEPNNGDGFFTQEDCLSLRRDRFYRWDDAPCDKLNGFICQLQYIFNYNEK